MNRQEYKSIKNMTDKEFDKFMEDVAEEYIKRHGTSFTDDLNEAERVENK